jgi:hypothetical protein
MTGRIGSIRCASTLAGFSKTLSEKNLTGGFAPPQWALDCARAEDSLGREGCLFLSFILSQIE